MPPGRNLLIWKDIELEAETWLTSLELEPATIIDLYRAHATAEQYHSEIKSELDLERLPSGSFKANSLVLHLGLLAYNVLRLLGVLGKGALKYRSPAKRHRMKTLIQELIRVPARILTGSDQLKLDIGRDMPGREAYLAYIASWPPPFPERPERSTAPGTCAAPPFPPQACLQVPALTLPDQLRIDGGPEEPGYTRENGSRELIRGGAHGSRKLSTAVDEKGQIGVRHFQQ